MSAGALDGVRVVEVAEGVAGPMTARLLGDAGADVVKVETADGDRPRGWGPPEVNGTSAEFVALNRNKRSVVVDDGRLDEADPDEWWAFHLDSCVKPPEHGYTCKDHQMYFLVGRVEDMDQLVADLHMEWVRDDPLWDLLRTDGAGGVGRYSHVVHDLWDRGLSQWTFAEAAAIIERHGGWAFPYLDYQEFLDDDHVRQMGLVAEVESNDGAPMREIRPPWQFSDTSASIRRPAPRLGADTAEVLGAFGDGQ